MLAVHYDPSLILDNGVRNDESPLIQKGLQQPGGLSGPACLPFTIRCVFQAREAGVSIPIVAGNGVQRPSDVHKVYQAGADVVAIGIVGIVRPWQMRCEINLAIAWALEKKLFSKSFNNLQSQIQNIARPRPASFILVKFIWYGWP